jgi:hypothetical protein
MFKAAKKTRQPKEKPRTRQHLQITEHVHHANAKNITVTQKMFTMQTQRITVTQKMLTMQTQRTSPQRLRFNGCPIIRGSEQCTQKIIIGEHCKPHTATTTTKEQQLGVRNATEIFI